MSHYERRLQQDLDEIQSRISAIADRVEAAVDEATRALVAGDRALANAVILGDLPINRESRAIDQRCHAFVARHLPSAGHLRFVSSVLRLNAGLERIGDQAVTVAREANQLSAPPSGALSRSIERITERSRATLREAVQAWRERDVELARGTIAAARQMDDTLAPIYQELMERSFEEDASPLPDRFAVFVVFGCLSRVSALAKNICEETVFTVTGETKRPKVYRVLFLDRDGAGLSQLARATAQKTFPGSGNYDAAGWAPADAPEPALSDWMERNGLPAAPPRPAPGTTRELARYHVIVSFDPDARAQIARVPFHTVLLDWDPATLEQSGEGDARYEALYRSLAEQIRELMVLLRGEEAR